ncbi:MAG: hypothetical protein JKY65_13185 [Planctomycetes bacterium]|nr:hypothetical protein [Planctomycetota bacterium]
MRTYRLLVEIGNGVWTYVVAACDHLEAWRVVLSALNPQEQSLAALEELEAGDPARVTGQPRVLAFKLSAGVPLGAHPSLVVLEGRRERSA